MTSIIIIIIKTENNSAILWNEPSARIARKPEGGMGV